VQSAHLITKNVPNPLSAKVGENGNAEDPFVVAFFVVDGTIRKGLTYLRGSCQRRRTRKRFLFLGVVLALSLLLSCELE
jgi:hypothetical protein